MCSGFGGRVCPDPSNCTVNPRPAHIEPPRMPDPPFIATEPPARMPQPDATQVRITIEPSHFVPDAYVNALKEAVEFLENDAEFWKSAFEVLALGIKVASEQRRDFERAAQTLAEARKGLCWYAYLQDERCKLPEGHIGDHGPKHQCDIDCGLSEDGCTLPVPANPVAYWKALFWELHGGSCPPTCRGHAS